MSMDSADSAAGEALKHVERAIDTLKSSQEDEVCSGGGDLSSQNNLPHRPPSLTSLTNEEVGEGVLLMFDLLAGGVCGHDFLVNAFPSLTAALPPLHTCV